MEASDHRLKPASDTSARRGQHLVEVSAVAAGYVKEKDVLSEASLFVNAGETVALLGPSGCGKTTLLRIIAGLQSPTSGTVKIGSRLVAGNGTHVEPHDRRVGMVFQDGALFPHLNVEDNVTFGLAGHADKSGRAKQVLDLVGMASYAKRIPGTLSGGQEQRVALARALAPEPTVLLLDEPFSALDAGLRSTIRRDVKKILSTIGIATIIVTHDQDEAFAMGDRVAVMNNGKIVQVGDPLQLYSEPANPWIAEFVGEANILPGVKRGRVAETDLGTLQLSQNTLDNDEIVDTAKINVLVRPEELELLDGGDGLITAAEYFGHDVLYSVKVGDSRLKVRTSSNSFDVGAHVNVDFVGSNVAAWPPAS